MRLDPIPIALTIAVLASELIASAPLAAQTPTTLVAGTMAGAVTRKATAWCAIDRGTTEFLRDGTGTTTGRMTFPDITYTAIVNGARGPQMTYYTLSGQGRLVFTNATNGTVPFDFTSTYPAAVRQPPFSDYVQSYNSAARLLTVSFDMTFPSCTLKIRANYRN